MNHSTQAKPMPDSLKLVAHELRWQMLAALAGSDRRVQELVALLQRPQNLVSYHLRLLREGQVVKERRSSADGRDVYYSLDLDRLRALFLDSGALLHPALACAASPEAGAPGPVAPEEEGIPPFRVLFLCTHNSARSQLAEGILRAGAGDSIEVASAGSEPGRVHPLAIRAAAALGVDISGQRSKHMQEFTGRHFDYVITVCDQVREVCPVFPDDPRQIHWSIRDPAAAAGTEEERYRLFLETARELATRIGYLRLSIEEHQQTQKEL